MKKTSVQHAWLEKLSQRVDRGDFEVRDYEPRGQYESVALAGEKESLGEERWMQSYNKTCRQWKQKQNRNQRIFKMLINRMCSSPNSGTSLSYLHWTGASRRLLSLRITGCMRKERRCSVLETPWPHETCKAGRIDAERSWMFRHQE